MPIFDNYFLESSFDEMFDSDKNIREHWKKIYDKIELVDISKLQSKQSEIDWHLEDNGVTYNIYNNADGSTTRPWSLDPIPFVIEKKEWDSIKIGLQQRAKLLNLIFRDIYSDQKLLKENILPAEVIFGHKGFIKEAYNFGYKPNHNLYFYAADMARGPDGKMWIINDRTQAPSGLGYAIENRLTMNVIAKDLYKDIDYKKIVSFIEEYKKMLQDMTNGDISKAALLTPGHHNETYFEHSFLSSFLEINLVKGEDLLSKNGSIWLKSLSGLQKIDTILRRVDDSFCDPLELRSSSRLGVAGLVEAVRQNNLNLINPLGSAILENMGLNPFMKAICNYFLDEDLIIPQIATWWCGQKKELDYVMDNFDSLIIKKIDKSDTVETYLMKSMTKEDRDILIQKVKQNPNQFVAQEEISFSTTPYFTNSKVEPRNTIIRSYAIKSDDEYKIMDGGLVRVSAMKDTFLVSSQKGGTSKDLWILCDEDDDLAINSRKSDLLLDTTIDHIPTLRAENLYWLGRYISRMISSIRLIRYVVKKYTNFSRYEGPSSKDALMILQKAITQVTMTYPGFFSTGDEFKKIVKNPMIEITSIIKDCSRQGSLSFTMSMLSASTINIKNLLALESWKLFDKMQKEWTAFANKKNQSNRMIVGELDKSLIYLMAYKELVEESIFKEQGLILYEIGYKIESAIILVSKIRSMLCLKLDKATSYDVLEGVLNSLESFNAYRARYKSSLVLENILEFLLLNPLFPKSLTYITDDLLKEFKMLPKSKSSLTSYEEPIFRAYSLLRLTDVESLVRVDEKDSVYTVLDEMLAQLLEYFIECSNEFSKTYFSHYDE